MSNRYVRPNNPCALMRQWVSVCALLGIGAHAGACTDESLESILAEPRYINVRIENYCTQTGYDPTALFVLNHSLWFGGDGSFGIDFDRDGLSDEFESTADNAEQFNIDPTNEDTLQDGYGDLLVASLGMVLDDQRELSKCESVYQDSDRDGLDDCEETLVGTGEYEPDFDKDGIPDGIEVRYGLNPLDIEDARLDSDQDGLTNADEIRQNTPLYRHNGDDFVDRQISYEVVDRIRVDGSECQQIDVTNIPIWDVENGNFVRLSFLETGFSVDHGTLSEIRTVTLIVSRYFPEDVQIVVKEINNQFQTEGFDNADSQE